MIVFLKKYPIAILAIVSAIGLLIANPFQTVKSLSEETLFVGLQSGYPPFESMNAEGKIVGFDIDLAELIAKKLGKKLAIKDMEFDGVILSLKQGRIDLAISGLNITPSRQKEILMIPYHGDTATSLSLLFWKEIPDEVQSLEDIARLSNPTVSVQAGAVSEIYLSRFKDIQAKSFDGALEPLMDVKYGKSAACLVEADVAEYLQKQHPQIKILSVPLPKDETLFGFGIGVNKENKNLFQKVQKIIQEIKSSGELKQLEDTWFKGGE